MSDGAALVMTITSLCVVGSTICLVDISFHLNDIKRALLDIRDKMNSEEPK